MRSICLAVGLLSLASPYASPSQADVLRVELDAHGRPRAAGAALVALEAGAQPQLLEEALRSVGARIGERLTARPVYRIVWEGPLEVERVLARLQGVAGVRYAEADSVGTIAGGVQTPPNDTHYGRQWHHENAGGLLGHKVDADVDSESAWRIQAGDPSILVAVLDNGFQIHHSELAPRYVPGWDFIDGDAEPAGGNHGHYVAGLLGAVADNAHQVVGMDRRASILPLRVVGPAGGTAFDLAQGIDFAVAAGARVVSISLAGYGGSQTVADSIAAAHAAGVVLVTSAGNDGEGDADIGLSSNPLTISVGMTGPGDLLDPDSGSGLRLDFAAPGSFVWTVFANEVDNATPFGGTSAAAPLVAGIASLLLAENPLLTPNEVYRFLRIGAVDGVGEGDFLHPDWDAFGWDPHYGHGRVNAAASLQALCACTEAQAFRASPPRVSLAQGGAQFFGLDFGPSFDGHLYWVLGSASGTAPPLVLPPFEVPLVFDSYFLLSVNKPNKAPFASTLGFLDAMGRASGAFRVPAGSDPSLQGIELNHAALVFDPGWNPVAVDGPRSLTLGEPARLEEWREDFEGGAPGWDFNEGFPSLWHVASAGECGSGGARLAYSQPPPACDIDLDPLSNNGTVRSPPILLLGEGPFRLEFELWLDVDPSLLDILRVQVTDLDGFLPTVEESTTSLAAGGLGAWQTVSIELPEGSRWRGRTVEVTFAFFKNPTVAGTFGGVRIDDLRLTSVAPGS